LRITLSAAHTDDMIARLQSALRSYAPNTADHLDESHICLAPEDVVLVADPSLDAIMQSGCACRTR